MRSVLRISTALVSVIAASTVAHAADILPPIIESSPPEIVTHSSSGWYLRGDIGYVKSDHSGGTFYTNGALAPHRGEFREEDLGDGWTLGVGIGYQISDRWRVDATYKHFTALDFDGDSSTSGQFACSVVGGIADNGVADTCVVSDTTEVRGSLLMANAYADLGTYAGFTPYVGAGIGGAKLHWSDLDNDIDCISGDCTAAGGENYNGIYDSKHGGKSAWRFAYSLHAGASYDINCKWKVDGGYSFTHIDGGGNMFGFPYATGASGTQGYHGDVKLHEVRAGLRYKLGGGGCSTPPAPTPMVYK